MIDGLKYLPQYLSPEEQKILLDEIDSQEWNTELRRRVQHYGYKYSYKNRSIDRTMVAPAFLPACDVLAGKLTEDGIFKTKPDQLIVNEYMPGQGIAPHIDCVPCFGKEIVSISLGWEYPMVFLKDGRKHEVSLAVGSLISLTGPARYKWTHSIASRKEDNGIQRQRRVSLTFRNVILNESSTNGW